MRPAVFLLLLSMSCTAQGIVVHSGDVQLFSGSVGSQTNNPVTMVFEHKQVQTLVDGPHITNITHETFYRDTLGRTRMENESPMFGMGASTPMRSISVQDPVAQTSTNWQLGGYGNMPHEYFRMDTNRHTQPIQMMTQLLAPPPVAPRPRAQIQPRLQPKNTTEQLGTQDVQGVPCEATRTTTVYPVDFMGNDRPITVTQDFCNSREFGRNIRESMEDPRTGVRTTTLQTISRGEPDPSLFQPPADYTEHPQQH